MVDVGRESFIFQCISMRSFALYMFLFHLIQIFNKKNPYINTLLLTFTFSFFLRYGGRWAVRPCSTPCDRVNCRCGPPHAADEVLNSNTRE